MADSKISALPLRTAVTGTDEIPTLAGGVNYRSPLSSIAALVNFANTGAVEGGSIPATIDLIQTLAYVTPGDGGGGIYRRVEQPSDIQSGDGAHWELVPQGPLYAAALGTVVGSTDNEPAIKKGLQKHVYEEKGSVLELPAGELGISRGLHVGYGDEVKGGVLSGEATTLSWDFTDEPGISIQGGKNVAIRGVGLQGPGARPELGGVDYSGFSDDTVLESWIPPSWSAQASSRYAPAAAIAVDPRTAPADAMHYRAVDYPAELGIASQYDKLPSSGVVIEGVDFYGGGVGVVVHPNKDSDGGGDLVRLTNCRMTGVAVGFSIGQTQAKQTSLDSVDMASVHTAVTTFLHGKQTGIFTSAWNCNFSGIQLYDIQYDENNTGDVVFNNVNSEALWRIGTSPRGRVVLDHCNLNFTNQNENRGVPAMLVAGSLETNGGEWKNFEGCASIYTGISHVAIDGTVMLPRIATTLQDMCFQNGTAGGLVFAFLASNGPIENINPKFRPWYFSVVYQDISAYGLDSYFLSSRDSCTPLWSTKHGSWYPPEIPVDIPSRVAQFYLGTGMTSASMNGLTLTASFPARTDQDYMLYGPLPGDVLWHEMTGSVFVCMTANTTSDVVTFELVNNYRGLEPRDPINLAVGEQFILGSLRWYSPENAVYGIFTSGSAVVTDAGSRYDGGGTQVASRLADDLAVGDWLVVDPALAPFIAQASCKITAISEAGKTITLTGNAIASSTKRVRLGTFVRPGPESLGGALLLRGELSGFAADFQYAVDANRVAVKVNNQVTYSTVNSFFSNASASPKWIYNAAGTLVSNAAGTPALDYDPVSHAPKGLLVEPASTNTIRQSNAIGINPNVDWGGTGQFTMNAITAPNGLMQGTKFFSFPLANGVHLFGGAGAVGLTGTYSLFAKAAEWSKIFLRDDNAPDGLIGEGFDLATGKIFTLPESILATGGAKITPVGNGWFRCSIPVANGQGSPTAFLVDDSYNFIFTASATGTEGVYVWGAQLEASPVPTSFIPTTTGAVTRAGDQVRITPAQINYSAEAGTWVADVELARAINNGRIVGYTAGAMSPLHSVANNSFAAKDTTTLLRDVSRGSGRNKVAVSFDGEGKAVTANGLPPTQSVGAELGSPGTYIGIGQDAIGGNQIHGYIRQLMYYPRKISPGLMRNRTAVPIITKRYPWNRPGGLTPHSSGREVYAWWFYFYRSFDNQPKAGDLYTNFLTDGGFQSTPTYGASLRDRPTSRDPIPPEEDLSPLIYFKVKDAQFECETAWDMGLDGFQVNVYGLDEETSDGQHVPTLLEGARRAELNGKSINIIIGLDGGILSGSPPEDLADYVRKFMHHEKAKKTADGKLVLGVFAPDITQATPALCRAYWQAVIDRIGETIGEVEGLPVFFSPSFLGVDPFTDPGWQAMCDAMGIFGSNSFSQQANIPAIAQVVMEAGIQWVAPLWPQDYRPNGRGGLDHLYRECQGSKLYRNGWEQAIAARDLNPGLQKMALIVTWNDFSEHGHILPSEPLQGIQSAFADLTAYYCVKYKTGTAPLIVRDQLVLFHRKERTDTYPATGASQPAATALATGGAADSATNNVEALAYIGAEASLEADRGDGTIGTVVTGTGLQVATVGLVTGQTPKARLKRAAATVLSLTSDFPVRATSAYQDLEYKGTSSVVI